MCLGVFLKVGQSIYTDKVFFNESVLCRLRTKKIVLVIGFLVGRRVCVIEAEGRKAGSGFCW